MTESEVNAKIQSGQVEQVSTDTSQTPPLPAPLGETLNDFLPALYLLRQFRQTLTAHPTFIPKSFAESIQFVEVGGVHFIDAFISGSWRQFSDAAGSSGPGYVTYDNSLDLGILGTGPTAASFTCAGANRVLLVAVHNNANDASASSVTYNGVALTELGHQSGSSSRLGLWYLLSPTIGANNLEITFPGTDTGWAGALSCANSVSQVVRNFQGTFAAFAAPPNAATINSALNSLTISMDYQQQAVTYSPPADTIAVNLNGSHFGITYKASSAPITTVGGWSGATSFAGFLVGCEIVF